MPKKWDRKGGNKNIKTNLRDEGRKLPLAGGLLEGICGENPDKEDYIKVEGSKKVIDLFDDRSSGEIKARFVDVLFCEGCINSVVLKDKNYFKNTKE